MELLATDIGDWRITFVNTGLHSNVGQRLKAVQDHLRGEELFLATYRDAVTDAPLSRMVANFHERGKTAAFLCVRPKSYSFHTVQLSDEAVVRGLEDVTRADMRINGGFFIFRPEIFEQIHEAKNSSRSRSRGDRRRGADRVSLRRLLGADGHAQGQAQPRSARGIGPPPMGGLDGPRRRRACRSGWP